MNGRIYDAKLGRFLQADPFIQAASNTQSYNRYSYVMNNPLNAIDPSGFFFKSLWDKVRPFVGAVVGVVLSIWCQGCGFAAYVAIGGVSGAAGAAANGGNILRGALTGAISAAAFYGIGQGFANCKSCFDAGKLTTTARVLKTASHAMAGGVMSVLQGGKFGHGFAAAGFTQAFARGIDAIGGDPKVNPTAYFSAGARVARIIVAATVGGTASKISGGKFANGAVTAAFSRGFNDEAHQEAQKNASREQSICKGSCHGYDGAPGRPMTAAEESLLNSGAAVIITLPVSGGLALLTTTGKVIQLSVQGQAVARTMAAAGQARTIQAGRAAQVLATDAALTTMSVTAPVVSNPIIQQNVLEFMEGFFVPGPPPLTPAGVLGSATSEVLSE